LEEISMPRKTKENSETKGKSPQKSRQPSKTVKDIVFVFDNSLIKKINGTEKQTKKTPVSTKKEKIKKRAEQSLAPTIEYYDLPYRYNKTIVKVLTQNPNRMFVYWDISDEDRKKYEGEYGIDFFDKSVPVLVVHNKTKNYSFEIQINDFANSWYFDIDDAKCEYSLELGRRSKENSISIPNNYLYITSSNVAEAPNDHILFEQEQKIVYFRNVKTNEEYSKGTAAMNLLRYMGKIFNAHDLYKKIYKDEEILDLRNPSSNNPTSKM